MNIDLTVIEWLLAPHLKKIQSMLGNNTPDFLRNIAKKIEETKEYSVEEMGAVIDRLAFNVLASGTEQGTSNIAARLNFITLFLTRVASCFGLILHFEITVDPTFSPGEKSNNGQDMII